MPEPEPPRFDHHHNCRTVTSLTLAHLPGALASGRSRRYPKDSPVWMPGDPSDHIWFVEQGRVVIHVSRADGQDVIVHIANPGEPFGELCFCAGGGVQNTIALAVLESVVVQISVVDFVRYLQTDHTSLYAMLITFCVRLSDAEHHVAVLAHRGAEERLGLLLMHLARTRSRPTATPREHISLSFTHEELARLAAMSRSHVTVTMGRLRDRGLVRYEREQPLLVDVARLEAYLAERSARAQERSDD